MDSARLFTRSPEPSPDQVRISTESPQGSPGGYKPPKNEVSLGRFSVQTSESQAVNSLNQRSDFSGLGQPSFPYLTPQAGSLYPPNVSSWPSVLPYIPSRASSAFSNVYGSSGSLPYGPGTTQSLALMAGHPSTARTFQKTNVAGDIGYAESKNSTANYRAAFRAEKGGHQRSNFTEAQVRGLEIAYKSSRYPDRVVKENLATTLDLSDSQVGIWFANRRMKSKRNKDCYAEELNKRNVREVNKVEGFSQAVSDTHSNSHTYTLLKDRNIKVFKVTAETDQMALQLMQEKLRELTAPASASTSETSSSQGDDISEKLSASTPVQDPAQSIYPDFQPPVSHPAQQKKELSSQPHFNFYTQS
ncbi:homeobox domain-containing protein [Endozoicomonas elysicola]|nr:homeobox domain-containing protein [Endozoicomonas elysicola]